MRVVYLLIDISNIVILDSTRIIFWKEQISIVRQIINKIYAIIRWFQKKISHVWPWLDGSVSL